ncbi:cell division cycle-associated protein 7-like [Denticeps clupeoides]|uniref:cell division cycle-associated protein 7-like n=1 Tax=Denticeps clupeoides TaxID=299321 RepID=UPI0010A2CDB2|nr:cell division cycle-associated protein 7-like [Denticeps clupeoides]
MDERDSLGMTSFNQQLHQIFAEESENDGTFYGFSDSEIGDLYDIKGSNSDEERKLVSVSPKKPPGQRFTLRVALRSKSAAPAPSDEDEEAEEGPAEPKGKPSKPKSGRAPVRVEEEAAALSGSESEAETFLQKRAMNIKANRAMLAQLMADLQKMPGGFLKNTERTSKKEPRSRVPRSSAAEAETRRNPERTARRQTRSMGGPEAFTAAGDPDRELELSLEEELLEVRKAPRPRAAPRPGKAHVIRPVEEITEDELQLVATNMTEKIYNRATGSTCHQCRQKTVDTKTCCRDDGCRGIQGQFCGPCLRNRYGEDVRSALLDPEWKCPPCRGICNCSFCRQRDGRCPTGILFPLAQYHGFSDVHSYLSSLRNKMKPEHEEDA